MMHDTTMGGGMMGSYGGYSLGYGLWNALLLIGVIIVLVAAVLFLLRETGFLAKRGRAHDKPLEILKERYAKGEITSEEYLKMKGLLEN